MTAAGTITTEQQARMAEELRGLGSATLAESGARHLPPRFRAVWPGAALAAPAVPVQCSPGDNLAIHVAAAEAPAGSALVVDVGGVARRGYWGEVLTAAAQSRGLAGLVIDGGVRDVAALRAHDFPVFSTTVSLPGATKKLPRDGGRSHPYGRHPGGVGGLGGRRCRRRGHRPRPHPRCRGGGGPGPHRQGGRVLRGTAGGRTTIELLGLDTSPVSVELPGI